MMIWKMPVAALSGLLLASACATTDTVPVWPEGQAESAARFEKDLTTLASDAYEGREAGTRGYLKAVEYVSKSFAEIGVKPAGDEGYLQQVPLRRATMVPDGAGLTINGEDMVLYQDYFTTASPTMESVDVTGEVVFVGHGLVAPKFGIDDYAGVDVRGKIVAIASGVPDGLPSEERAHFQSGSTKMAIAQQMGAIGVLGISEDRAEDDQGKAQMVSYVSRPDEMVAYPEGQSGKVDIYTLLSKAGTEKLLEAAGLGVDEIFSETMTARPLGVTARLTSKTTFDDYTAPNVVGVIKGSDPALADEYIVLTAHLDHIGMLKSVEKDKDLINNGAMDNATGVSTLLEEARKFKMAGNAPRRSVLFVALTAEEKGLLGSEYFARNPTVPASSMVANVNLDMPILLYDFTDAIAFGAEHSSIRQIAADAGATMGVKLSPDPVPDMVLFVRSDHYNFVKAGVPSIFLFPGWENGGQEKFTWFLQNNYHRPGDEPTQGEAGILYDVGAKFAELNFRIAKALADADERPTWNEGDFFGDTFAPKSGM
ncbi:M28 family metallopeptidase [Parvularcula sp. LCG005]|uniref:M28 family metallopeptidase n=1 Tax=Parvularcula sp. LCG005 TaxID=3078805 RepID=UPI002942294D|nr:M28 family metallopeptidase [Parvularcula sp. LCG005]WOI52258.1 M28 family metallopeptidase [Parvularcula sp. LCG005]